MIETMDRVDNFWLHMDHPTNLMVITGILEFDQRIDFERLMLTFENRLIKKFDRFKKKVTLPISGVGLPQWETDPFFDIRSHVHRVALPSPGDKKALEETVSDLMVQPLDMSKPLWQAYLVENYNGDGCVLFAKLHHCIADGIALIYVLLSLTDLDANAPLPKASKKKKKKEPFTLASLLPFQSTFKGLKKATRSTQQLSKKAMEAFLKGLANPAQLKDSAKYTANLSMDTAGLLAKLIFMPPDPKTSFKGPLGVRKLASWSEPISLRDIKTIGKAVDATVNDVLIAAVTGALRTYLQNRHNRINKLDLRVAVPVNVRKPGTEFELGNKFSLVFIELPIYIKDPILRLKEVKRRMDHLKTSPDAFLGFQALNMIGISPANIAKKAAQFFASKMSGIMTNVPGPRQPLYLAGKPIKNMMFWVPRTGRVSLGVSVISYNGSVTMGVVCDEKLVSDPEVILEGFKTEFNNYLDLVQSGNIERQWLILHDRALEMKNSTAESTPEEQPELTSDQCSATTKAGTSCKNKPLENSQFCRIHQPK